MNSERPLRTPITRILASVAAMIASATAFTQQPTSQPPLHPPSTRPPAAGDLQVTQPSADTIVISAGKRPILVYRSANSRKPYIRELYTPAGVQFLLDAPPDHVHHHGIMFALGVNGVDFWSEGDNTGREVDLTKAGATSAPTERSTGRITQQLRWIQGTQDEPLLLEERSIELAASATAAQWAATLVTWRSRLELPSNLAEAQITGSHYFGLGLRFVRSMDKTGKFITSDPHAAGEVVRNDETLYPGRWCAYSASVEGKTITVAMFDGPNNVRPATWFTMKEAFAYLSATLNLHKEPLTLKRGEPLQLTYGIAAWDGEPPREQIEKLYRLWLEQVREAPQKAHEKHGS